MTNQATNDLILEIYRACERAYKYAQDARGAMWDVNECETNLRLARVACDAALERLARLRGGT